MNENERTDFIRSATWHGSLTEAEDLRSRYPAIGTEDIFTAAITGNVQSIKTLLAADSANATATAPPYGGNALVYLCLSKYLRFNKERSEDFIAAATALLDAGADPNSGFWTTGQFPEFETALYGAAGVAHHAALTQLLLSRGANPNDEEAVYHSPENYDNAAMKLLVETGRLTADNLAIMLVRKHDWHDYDGVKWLLENGANPNGLRSRGWYPLHHALARDNHIAIVALLFEHGVDPFLQNHGINGIVHAAREGRRDVLELMHEKGIDIRLQGADRLIAACAMGDAALVQQLVKDHPQDLAELKAMGGHLLAKFCGTGNVEGVAQLLNIGVDVNTPFLFGDGYYEIPPGSLPIHVATWRARPAVVQLLIEKGAAINARDQRGRSPLALAIKACVDSYWKDRRSPDSVKALLDAGASTKDIAFPCGYKEVDDLLQNATG